MLQINEEKLMFKKILLAAACSAAIAGCNDNSTSSSGISLVEGSFSLTKSLGDVVFSKAGVSSEPLALNVGFGSGAYHYPGDANNIFYTLTDRGPNIKCKDADALLGIVDFCPADGDKVFPIPDFTPSIYKMELTKDQNGNLGYTILEEIPLKDASGNNITGLTNAITVTDTEVSVGIDGAKIAFDNNGLDTESLVRLSDGSFWLSDEYGPSLVHVASDGKIIKRLVPVSMEADYANAGYPVVGLLPDILKMRKLNRGIESVAVSPSESYLYFSMQSPLANPNKGAYSASRHVRLFKLALTNGDVTSVEGEFVYRLDMSDTFADTAGNGDVGKKQSNVKVSEMVAVGEDDLIVLERVSKTTKFYRVDLSTGDNIKDITIANQAVTTNENEASKTLEQIYDLDSHGAHPLAKVLAFNTLTDMPEGILAPKKIEGIAVLDDEYVLFINDNDFGIKGADTSAIVLKVAQRFTANETKSRSAKLNLVARHEAGQFDESAAEIVSYHKSSNRIYAINAYAKKVDIISGLSSNMSALTNPLTDSNLSKDASIDVSIDYSNAGGVNSVAISGNLLAVAVEDKDKQMNGVIAFYALDETTGAATHISHVEVGALPDSILFSPDGSKLIVACEGEPSGDYSVDPEGVVAVIDINSNVPANAATIIDFNAFNMGASRHSELPTNFRAFGGAFGGIASTVAQDLEPEYVAISEDSSTAYVSLQENNAIAVIDLSSNSILRIMDLGTKDYSKAVNALDVSDRDKNADTTGTLLNNGKARINIKAWDNIVGMYQPDTIVSYSANGKAYIVTANEGDAREYLSGKINTNYTTLADCESASLNWDASVNACFKGDTPTACAANGFLNKSNEECFSYVEEFRVEDLSSTGSYSDFVEPIPLEVSALADKFSDDITAKINDEELGRLKISIVDTLDATTGTINTLQSYGARSFSIWDEQGGLVFDSASDISKITAGRVGQFFNASNDKPASSKKNDRSSAKGPEPEALTIGEINGRTYAFVGLERVGGIMVYDITSPYGVQFIEYTINRDFTKDPSDPIEGAQAGDVGPEGMKFVSAENSPTGKALLIVGNEVSGTTSVYEVE